MGGVSASNGVSGAKDGGFGSHDIGGAVFSSLGKTFSNSDDPLSKAFGSVFSGVGNASESIAPAISKTIGSFTGANAAQAAADAAQAAVTAAAATAAQNKLNLQQQNMQSDQAASSGAQAIRNTATSQAGGVPVGQSPNVSPSGASITAATSGDEKDFLGL